MVLCVLLLSQLLGSTKHGVLQMVVTTKILTTFLLFLYYTHPVPEHSLDTQLRTRILSLSKRYTSSIYSHYQNTLRLK